MNISFEEVNNILATLPISYYVKRKIPVKLSNASDCSYYDMKSDEIVISYTQLQRAFTDTDDAVDKDSLVRTMLYHEVSHALITPRTLKMTTVVNIVEDERIETLLRNAYMNVNFKALISRLTKNRIASNADEAFFLFVRLHIADRKWLIYLTNLIKRYRTLTEYDAAIYACECNNMYLSFTKDWNKRNTTSDTLDNSKLNTPSNVLDNSKLDNATLDNSKLDNTTSDTLDGSKLDNTTSDITDLSVEELSDYTFVVNENVNPTMFATFKAIFSEQKKINHSSSSAINSYSGMFDVRSVVRDDYKYFLQNNRSGHRNAYSKIHLNLFIDCSGSFRSSDKVINEMLNALIQLERINSNFTFDMISCGMYNRVRDKNDRYQLSRGGNRLNASIYKCFNAVQHRNEHNINIICFDGYAWTNSHNKRSDEACAAVWNNSNCAIITSNENIRAFKQYCPAAHITVCENYASVLYDTVVSSLRTISRF